MSGRGKRSDMATARQPQPQYPIRVVSRMTGLSLDTLRAWERRYSAVVPQRNERGRLYSDADVARLQQLEQLVARGHAIGTIARVSGAELAKLLHGGDELTMPAVQPKLSANLEPLTSALDRFDLNAIEATLNRYAALLPPRDLVFAVMLPLLRHIGRPLADRRSAPRAGTPGVGDRPQRARRTPARHGAAGRFAQNCVCDTRWRTA